jgi:hypothetical protein
MNSVCFERTFSCIHLTTRIQRNLQPECCDLTTCNIILVQKRNDLYCTEDTADVTAQFLLPSFAFLKTILHSTTCLYMPLFAD